MVQKTASKNRRRWERAATLVADDNLTDERIAAKVGITRQTLARWKRDEAFQQRVQQVVDAYRDAIVTQGIADKVERVKALNDRWERMKQVIEERGADPSMEAVPGGTTGLLTRAFKSLRSGKDSKVVAEYTVDAGLLAQMTAHEAQAAKELGQWVERSQVEYYDTGIDESLNSKLDCLAARLRTQSVPGEPVE